MIYVHNNAHKVVYLLFCFTAMCAIMHYDAIMHCDVIR